MTASVGSSRRRMSAVMLLLAGTVLAMGIVVAPDASTGPADATTVWQNTNVSMVTVGDGHTCAIQSGVVFCWGAGTSGQLGYTPPPRPPVLPAPANSSEPKAVSSFSGFQNNGNVTKVSAGGTNTCAIESGVLYCWGSGSVGQLGNGRYTQSNFPSKVSAANGFDNNGQVTDVWAGGYVTCAIESGEAFCWGANGLGVVGNGTTTGTGSHPNVPRKVVANGDFANSGVTAITVGLTACAVEAGELFCWGAGSSGQMGNGSLNQSNTRPVKVGAGSDGFVNNNVTSVSNAGILVCAVRLGAMYCWGNNGYGNGGVGVQVTQQTSPRKVSAVNGMTNAAVTSASVGNASCVVDAGIVYCMGINYYGMVGDGTTMQRLSPTLVSATGGMANNGSVTMVSAETFHACALELGSVFCWGQNDKGQMGNGTTGGNQLSPQNSSVAPGTPTITGATVGTTTASVTVSAGPGATPTSYTVTAQPGGLTCTVTPPETGCTIEALTPGTAYTFTAVASNSQGTSSASTGVVRTTGAVAVPGTPGVVAGTGQLTVTPTPGSGGGSATGYVAYASPGGASCTVLSPATSCVISPLTDGIPYTVTTSAFNDAGPSNSSGSVTVTPGVPGAPPAPIVEVGNRSATVTVSAGAGGTPSYYTVTATTSGGAVHSCTVTPPATSCQLTGLTNGTDYTFTTTATNDGGTSGSSSETTELVDLLAIPAVERVEVGATGVTVSVSTDPSGGTVQAYEVYLEPGGFRCSVLDAPTTSSCFIDGLTQGVTYTVTTTAINGIGTSSASPASPFEFDAPGESQLGVASIGTGTMTVTVSAGTPGGPPSSYLVVATPGLQNCTVVVPDDSCVITGLTGGQTYTVTASATNGLSTSTQSAQFIASLTPPGEPPVPTVVVGNSSATVSVAPGGSGGIPSSYTVIATTSAGASHTCTVTPPATGCTLTGLTNGTNYTFSTIATNAYGTSPTSSATVALVDTLPVSLEPALEVGGGGVTVSVSTEPTAGVPQSHTVYAEPGGHTCTVTPPATACFLPGLTSGTLYTVTSTATNTIGTSPASPGGTVLFSAPGAPQIGGVTIGFGQVTVSVSPTTSGGPATSYVVHVGPSTCTVVPPATSCTVMGLTGGQVYDVTASATNGAGTSISPSAVPARLLPPDAPPAPTVYVASGSATVLVSPPAGGETPSSYIVTAQPGGHTCTVTPPDVLCDITGLTNGTEYSFTVEAVNAYGPSTPGVATLAMVAEPATPPAPVVTPGDGQATVTVRPGTGGGSPTVYIVTAQPGAISCTVTAPATSCVLEGLTNDLEYTVTVVGANDVGTSLASASSTVIPRPPAVLPPAIGGLITSPATTVPSSTVPPATTVPTTRPPVTAPSGTVPPAVDPATGVLPELEPGVSTVIVDGEAVPVEVTAVSPTEVVVASAGFELRLVAECSSLCEVATNADGQPVIQLEPTGGVRVTGTGFLAGSVAYVWLFSEPRLLGTVMVNADGTFTGVLPVGALEAGEHTLQVNGISATGATRVANLGVVVTDTGIPTPGPGRLPATGNGSSSNVATVALVLMLLGTAALMRRRTMA